MWANPELLRPHVSPPLSGYLARGPSPVPTSAGHAVQAAGCFLPLGTGSGPLFGRLITAVGPFVPAFLCLPTLCLGEWESQHVCCVNTSWNPVIEIAEGVRPYPPAAWGPAPPWMVGVGKQVDSSQPVTHPFTHRTARSGLDRCLEPARAAPGREQDSEGPALSPLGPAPGTSQQKWTSGL